MTGHRERNRQVAIVVALCTLALVAITITAAPGAAANETTSNETVSDALEGPYSLAELRDGGREIAGADPSTRWIDDGAVYVDYASADPFGPSTEDWEVENILASGSLVEVDELTIHADRGRDAETTEYRLVVVTYDVEHVSTGDGAQTRAAVDQSVTEHELVLRGPFAHETIRLGNTDGETEKVAMWLEDADGDRVDGAQWAFEHRSTPTSVDAGISTTGELYGWVGLFVVLPGAIGIPLAVKGVRRVHAKTGKGPMIPGMMYGAIVVVALFTILLWGWWEFATLLVEIPLLLGVALVAIAALAYLEMGGGDVIRAEFIRDELGTATSPSGEEIPDVIYQDTRNVKLTRLDEDGTFALIKPGFRPFLARLFGVAPTLDLSELETQIRVDRGRDDLKLIANPESDAPIVYIPPKLRFPLTGDVDDDAGRLASLLSIRWNVLVGAGLGAVFGMMFGGVIGLAGLGAGIGGLAGFAITAARVTHGVAEFDPAPIHYLNARPAVLQSGSELEDAKTIDDMEEIALTATTETALEARRLQSKSSKTVSERMNERELGISDFGDRTRADDVDDRDDQDVDQDAEESSVTSLVVRND